jgi:hypothetical protein
MAGVTSGDCGSRGAHPAQRGQDRSVRPREPGPVDLPAQYRDLVPVAEPYG